MQAVDPRQIDQHDLLASGKARLAGTLLNRHTGIVRHLLAQARETVEQRGLAGIGRADDCHYARMAGLWRSRLPTGRRG